MTTDIATRNNGELMPAFSIESAVGRYNAVVEFTKTIMKPDKDYGTIPGTDKPTLLKPGAEKLCSFFGLSVDYEEMEKTLDWDRGLFFFTYKAVLCHNGQLVATGIGSSNSYEKKYRWRWMSESDLPANLDKTKMLSRSGSIREPMFAISKADTSGKYGKPAAYWQKFKDGIENGSARRVKLPKRDGTEMEGWEIGGTMYRVQNDDMADVLNTIQKMAQKRALIAATLIAANASEFYTQDLDDLDIIEGDFTVHPEPADDAKAEPKQPEPKPMPRQAAKPAAPTGPLASSEQVKHLKSLLVKVTLPKGTVDKWYAAAGVKSFDQLTSDQIEKCIKFCESKLVTKDNAPTPENAELSAKDQYVDWFAKMELIAQEVECPMEIFNQGIVKCLKAAKCSDKPWESNESQRQLWEDVLRSKAGYFAVPNEVAA
jgi:hypothetical protein